MPYFKQGLENNDACVWLVADLTVEEAENALATVVPNLEHYMATGQMQIRHYTEFYTNPVKPADALRDQFAEMGSTMTAKASEGFVLPGMSAGSITTMPCPGSWITKPRSIARSRIPA